MIGSLEAKPYRWRYPRWGSLKQRLNSGVWERPKKTPTFLKNRGSTTCLFGGLGPKTDEPLKISPKYQDTSMFFPTTKDRIFEICAPLYSQGMSLREIAKQIDLPRTTIKAALNAGGLPMRSTSEANNNDSKSSRPMKAGAVPYGYAYLEGQGESDFFKNANNFVVLIGD